MPKFTIIFDGKFQQGQNQEEVKIRLAKLFKTSPEKIGQLCARTPVIVKNGLNQEQAMQYKQAFEKTGALCRVLHEAEESAAPPPIPQPEPPTTPPPPPHSGSLRRRPTKKPGTRAKKDWNATLYSSTRYYQETGAYQYVLWPIVKFKQIVEAIFDTILTTIWNELMGAKYQPGQAGQFVAFIIFSVLAFAMPHIPDGAKDIALFVGIVCWLCDRFLAQYVYLQTVKLEKIFLTRKDESQMLWKKIDATDEAFSIDFDRHSIDGLSIQQEKRFGGAFQDELDSVWQLVLCLDDGADLLLDEREELMPLIKSAKKLAQELELSLAFAGSEGEGSLAAEESALAKSTIKMSLKHFSPGKVGVEQIDGVIELSSRWNLKSLSRFLSTTIHQSGFLLFLLVMEGVLLRYGTLLNWMIGPYFGIHGTRLVLNISFRGVLSIFSPDAGLLDLAEISVALGVMVYHGWKISRPKRVSIDAQKLRYFVGRRSQGELNTPELESPLFIAFPEPFILIMDQQQSVQIEQLQTENEYRGLMINIQEAVASVGLQNSPPPRHK